MVKFFDGNDETYMAWLAANPRGYVINARRSLSPNYMVLHRASCHAIRHYSPTAPDGAFTERGYVKICATDILELNKWVKRHGRLDGSFSKSCSLCN
jgi:hypothetical protein